MRVSTERCYGLTHITPGRHNASGTALAISAFQAFAQS